MKRNYATAIPGRIMGLVRPSVRPSVCLFVRAYVGKPELMWTFPMVGVPAVLSIFCSKDKKSWLRMGLRLRSSGRPRYMSALGLHIFLARTASNLQGWYPCRGSLRVRFQSTVITDDGSQKLGSCSLGSRIPSSIDGRDVGFWIIRVYNVYYGVAAGWRSHAVAQPG